jgi:hypothetical protein
VFRHEYGYGFLLDEAIERRFQRQHPHFVELTSALGFASPNRAARYLKSHPDLENWIWARAEHEMPDGDIVPFTIGWFDWRRPSAARVLSCGYLRAGDERERCLYRLYLREKPPYVSGANRIGRLQTNTVILSSYWLTAWYERNTRSRSTWEAFATYGSRNAVEHVVLGGGYRYYLLGHFGLGVFAEVLGGARYHRFYNTDYGNAFFGPAVGAKGALPVGLTAQVRVGATYAVGYKSEGGTTIADVGLGWSF